MVVADSPQVSPHSLCSYSGHSYIQRHQIWSTTGCLLVYIFSDHVRPLRMYMPKLATHLYHQNFFNDSTSRHLPELLFFSQSSCPVNQLELCLLETKTNTQSWFPAKSSQYYWLYMDYYPFLHSQFVLFLSFLPCDDF